MTDLFELIAKLGLRISREAFEALLTHAGKSKLAHTQLLEQLCELERREREARNLARRSKMATLGAPAALDRFDWNHPRKIDKALFDSLLGLDFVRRGDNVLFRGPACRGPR